MWAMAGAARYGFPSRKLKVIGITGTNGKSTTAEMLAMILKEAGYKVALSSSIKFEMAGDVRKNSMSNSMPGRFFLQKFLDEAVRFRCDYAIVEVTSEGIKQHRHRFIKFDGAVFTNLTPEHIESHGGFDNYRKAKLKLFETAKGFHVINCDDENAVFFLKYPAKTKYYYGFGGSIREFGAGQAVCARDVQAAGEGVGFSIDGIKFEIRLAGQFNVYNALAAISAAISQGVDLDICRRALVKIRSIPGRMEKICRDPDIFIDYAFTPNALEKAYATLKSRIDRGGKLICLLGACGGGRDKWKRPVLGQIAAKYCDRIIITNEDPFDEDPQAIMEAVRLGTERGGAEKQNVYLISDRRQAIVKALNMAEKHDSVILTGKGCEPWIRLKHGQRIPWNEKNAVMEELAKIKAKE